MQPSSSGQGLFTRFLDWAVGPNEAPSTSSRVPPDFTAQSADPDKQRLRQSKVQKQHQTLEEKWRTECLAAGRSRRLKHVADMRILHHAPDVVHREGEVVIIVGAHYRSKAVTTEEVLLHTVQEFEKFGGKSFCVVYFNADTSLSAVPDTVFFSELHAALPPNHRQQLKGIFIVHPTALLKSWVWILRLQEPEIYTKVHYVTKLSELFTKYHFDQASLMPSVPQHVMDHEES